MGGYIEEHVFESGSAHAHQCQECFGWQGVVLARLGLILGASVPV